MVIIIIIGLILLNGLFSMSEISVISARKSKLSHEARHGSKSAKAALDLSERPENFLSTVQVGITLIGILTGLYSGEVLDDNFSTFLEKMGLSARYSHSVAQISIIAIVTYVTIIFGELVPKRIGLSSAEKISKIIARPMYYLSIVASPFVWILSKSTALIFNLLGIKDSDSKVTEEEIKMMIKEGAEDGEVQAVEQDIVERVFTLGDRDLESIMTHSSEIVWLSLEMNCEQIREVICNHPFNKYPVIDKEADNVEGMVFIKDIFTKIDTPDFNLRRMIQPIHHFYENKEVYGALEEMKSSQIQHAFVYDEFGTVKGMVTLKDILEALVGNILEPDEAPDIIERADGSYLVDGQCSFYNFLDYFKWSDLYSKYEYNTLSGLILELLGHIPETGEQLNWKMFTFEIVDMDGARIDKVLVNIINEK